MELVKFSSLTYTNETKGIRPELIKDCNLAIKDGDGSASGCFTSRV